MPHVVGALLAALLCVAWHAAPAQAQRKAPTASKGLPDVEIPAGTTLSGDAQDVVFVDSSRVLTIRLHLQVNGLGFRESWDVFTDKFFDYADANADGSLNAAEIAAGVRMLGVSGSVGAMDTAPKDGKVTRQEWTAALARFGETRFSAAGQGNARFFTPDGRAAPGSNPGSALWKLLDTDGDMVMTKDELSAAARVLRKLDLDDDEILLATELQPYNVNPYGQYFVLERTIGDPPPESPLVLVIPARGDLTSLARQLLSRRDGRDKTTKDQKLSPTELPLSKEEFAAADTDRSGDLDVKELADMLRQLKPQLALVVRQGPETGRRGKFALAAVDGKPAPLAASVRGNPRGTITLDVGTLQLQFTAADWTGPTNYEQSYKPQFQSLDQDGNAYLDKKEVENNYGGDVFTSMDRDRDGMVYLKEFVEYFRQTTEIAQSRLSLQGNDQGKLLFDLVDANRDGRLGPRELAEAAGRMPQWDRNKDDKLEEAEVPHQYTLSIGRGGGGGVVAAPVAFMGAPRPTSPSPAGGPPWFVKMDRNRDGDLSPREFLGSTEAFDRLDANGDGLIDAAEAFKAGANSTASSKKAPASSDPPPQATPKAAPK